MNERPSNRLQIAWSVLVTAGKSFGPDRAGRMAAAIAYRAVFAVAPLLIVAVGVAGILLGSEEAQASLIEEIEKFGGADLAEMAGDFISSATELGGTAAIVGVVLLLWLISSLFLEVQRDLDDIFGVPYEYVSGLKALARQRGVGAIWSIGLGLVLITVVLLNSLWRFLGNLFPESLEGLHAVVGVVAPFVSLLVLPVVFALIMQTMTSITLPWRPVFWGAVFMTITFMLSLYGVGLYFDVFGSPTALGITSSLVVVLFLAYVLSSVFLFGAEVTAALMEEIVPPEDLPPESEMVAAEPPTPVAQSAILGFLGGLFVGWWRSNR